MIYTEARHTPIFRGFEPGAFSLEVNKMIQIPIKNLRISKGFEPASFSVNGFNATSELPGRVQTVNNSALLIKTHVTVLLDRPAFINWSATQSQWAAIFPKKATTTVCLGFYLHTNSMSLTKDGR